MPGVGSSSLVLSYVGYDLASLFVWDVQRCWKGFRWFESQCCQSFWAISVANSFFEVLRGI